MKAREYTKRVEFYATTNVADGYGGFTVTEALIATSWAKVETGKSRRLTDLGITDPVNTIVINLRHRNDIKYNAINQFIRYRGIDYIIQNAPTNKGFEDVDVEIIATRQILETTP